MHEKHLSIHRWLVSQRHMLSCHCFLQAVSERLVLTQALTALASSPANGDDVARLAGQVAAFAAGAAKEEGRGQSTSWVVTCASRRYAARMRGLS